MSTTEGPEAADDAIASMFGDASLFSFDGPEAQLAAAAPAAHIEAQLAAAHRRIHELETAAAMIETAHANQIIKVLTASLGVSTPAEALAASGEWSTMQRILAEVPLSRYAAAFTPPALGGVGPSHEHVPTESTKVAISWVMLMKLIAKYGTEYIDHISRTTPNIGDLVQRLSTIPALYVEAFEILHAVAADALPEKAMPRFDPAGSVSVEAYIQQLVNVMSKCIQSVASKKAAAPDDPTSPTERTR